MCGKVIAIAPLCYEFVIVAFLGEGICHGQGIEHFQCVTGKQTLSLSTHHCSDFLIGVYICIVDSI